MQDEKINLRITQNDQIIEALVYSKSAQQVEVVIGEGVHSVKCKLSPTDNAMAFAGSVMGREIVYERSPRQVQADLDEARPSTRRR